MREQERQLKALNKEEIKLILEPRRLNYEIAIYSSENYFNCGSIIRTSHGFLCRKIWLIDFNKFYKKASMGTHKYENINKVSLEEFLSINSNRNIVLFERREGIKGNSIFTYQYPTNPIMFFGSEKFGVPEELLSTYPVVTIPLGGVHNDLNIAVAAAIVMYDYLSKQYKQLETPYN